MSKIQCIKQCFFKFYTTYVLMNIFLLLLFVSMLFVYFLEYYLIDWKQVPAWVQAIGSVLAILAAVYIGDRTRKKSLDLKRKSNLAVIDAVHDYAAMFIEHLKKDRDTDHDYVCLATYLESEIFSKSMSEGMLERLKILPVNEISLTPAGIRAYFKFCQHFSIFIDHIQIFINGLHNHQDFSSELKKADKKDRPEMKKTQYKVLKNNALRQIYYIKKCYKEITP